MVELSVGVVSALIAAGIAVSQFILPNALALILTSNLSESHSAVTWSVVSRFFLSSDWPLLLRSDHTASAAVSREISILTWTKPVGLFLIAVAAIVTPLGLYDDIVPDTSTETVQFVYVADDGVFGPNTQARSGRGYNFSRTCSGKDGVLAEGSFLCPGDPFQGNITLNVAVNSTINETVEYYIVPTSISPQLIELYSGGLVDASPSLSSYFDVEFRNWDLYKDPVFQDNGTLLERAYKFANSVLMDAKYELVEGLVVDAISGGIGFRNHSVPTTNQHEWGLEWEEDILWMQPESSCVDSNLSMTFTGIPVSGAPYGLIVDNGGFINLQKNDPYFATEANKRDEFFTDGQANPRLYERAYYLAWGHNILAMEYFNITDLGPNRSRISSTLGQTYNVSTAFTANTPEIYHFEIRAPDDTYMISAPSESSWNITLNAYNGHTNFSNTSADYNWPNPHNITRDMLLPFIDLTGGPQNGTVSIDRLDIHIGHLAGPGFDINQSDPMNATSLVTYHRPLFMCAAATKMSFKTVKFRYNTTRINNLQNLEILGITNKDYSQGAELPLWGFEMPWENTTSTWNLSQINPLWGFVDSSSASSKNVTTLRSDHFYLPASSESLRSSGFSASSGTYEDYTPATSGPSACWAEVFSSQDWTSDKVQLAFVTESMKNTTAASRMLNLMWTHFATNAMIGTRGIHTPKYQPTSSSLFKRDLISKIKGLETGQYQVNVLRRQTRYNWIYGIPAAICGGIVVTAFLLALLVVFTGRGSVGRLKFYMFSISSGRIFTFFTFPEKGEDKLLDTKSWVESVGHKQIQLYERPMDVDTNIWDASFNGPTRYIRLRQKENTD